MGNKQTTKKLILNKRTISTLQPLGAEALKAVKAGVRPRGGPCWENLWTLYYCDILATGNPGIVEDQNEQD